MSNGLFGRMAAALTFSTTIAWSQTPPPPAAPAPQSTPPASQPSGGAAPAPAAAPTATPADEPQPPGNDESTLPDPDAFSFGVYGWQLGGNLHQLRQYATPAGGLEINDFRYLSPAKGDNPFFRITGSGGGEQDYVVQGLSIFDSGRLALYTSNNRFGFSNTTPMFIPGNLDESTRNDLTFMITPDLALIATYRSRERDLNYGAPIAGQCYHTANYGVGLEGKALSGEAGLSFDGQTFVDDTGAQPDWTRNRYQVHYGGDLTSYLSMEGSVATTLIDQSGNADGRVTVYNANANLDVSPTSSLFFDLQDQEFSLPTVQNAYVQKRVEGSVRYEGRFAKQRLGLGFEHKEEAILNAAHSYVDIAAWNDFNGRLSGRLSNASDYAFTFNWQRFNKGFQFDPEDLNNDDPLALYWSDQLQSQFRLEGEAAWLQWYASESFSLQKNVSTDVQLRSYDTLIGASFNYKQANTIFVEGSHQVYAAQGDQDLAGLSLNQFFPAGTSLCVGFTRQISPKSSASATLNHTFTDYVNPMMLPGGNVNSTQLTLQFTQQVGRDTSLSAIFAPWTYTDAYSLQAGYHATLFGLSLSTKF